MEPPKHYWRVPTREAIDSLAARFGLRNEPEMQGWEYEVADASRLPEFLAAMEGELTDDERFTLSLTVMESFEDWARAGAQVATSDEWRRFVAILRARPSLYAYTLWSWSSPELEGWEISPLVRALWAKLEPTIRPPA